MSSLVKDFSSTLVAETGIRKILGKGCSSGDHLGPHLDGLPGKLGPLQVKPAACEQEERQRQITEYLQLRRVSQDAAIT